VWWYRPIIPAFGRLRQEDREFEVGWAEKKLLGAIIVL
jgi:hypothetical protein